MLECPAVDRPAADAPRRVAFTSRWWQTTAIVLALLTPLGSALVVAWIGAAMIFTWGNPDTLHLPALIALLTLLSISVAARVATVRERKRPPEETADAARRIRRATIILLCVVFVLLTSPAGLMLAGLYLEHTSTRAQLRDQLRDARPITAGPQVGFCAPPVYGVSDGLPMVRLTARLPRRGEYDWYAAAHDSMTHLYDAVIDTVLPAGVTTLTLHLESPRQTNRGQAKVAWPVNVDVIWVQAGAPDKPRRMVDRRRGPLAIIRAPSTP